MNLAGVLRYIRQGTQRSAAQLGFCKSLSQSLSHSLSQLLSLSVTQSGTQSGAMRLPRELPCLPPSCCLISCENVLICAARGGTRHAATQLSSVEDAILPGGFTDGISSALVVSQAAKLLLISCLKWRPGQGRACVCVSPCVCVRVCLKCYQAKHVMGKIFNYSPHTHTHTHSNSHTRALPHAHSLKRAGQGRAGQGRSLLHTSGRRLTANLLCKTSSEFC